MSATSEFMLRGRFSLDAPLRSGTKRALEQVMDCPFAFFAEVSGPRAHECLVFNYWQALRPGVVLPGKPGIPVLIEHTQGAVEKFR